MNMEKVNKNEAAKADENLRGTSDGGLLCPKCSRMNRAVARYCRFCGEEMKEESPAIEERSLQARQEKENEGGGDCNFVGLDGVKKQIAQFIARKRIEREQKKQGLILDESTTVIVFRGETGTGKTLVAEYLISQLQKSKCLESGRVERVTAKSLKRSFADEFSVSQHLEESRAGVLLVDEVQEDVNFLHELLLGLTKRASETVCILVGTQAPLDEYFKNHPEDVQRVADFYEFPTTSSEVLCKILERKISEIGFEFDDSVRAGFMNCIQEAKSNPACVYKNGWIVEKEIIKKIRARQAARLQKDFDKLRKDDYRKILVEDLPAKAERLTSEEILAQMDRLIGMEGVKKAVRELAQTISMSKERERQGLAGSIPSIHMVFTGNPGTGKTTVARLLGKLFHSMQLLPSDKVVEVDKSKMVGQYVGETPKLVSSVIESAMGGVLFIDEAYTLAGDGVNKDTFGQEAIDTLLKSMEDNRGKFVVIAAGYEKEMQNFISANPGLKSRFTHFIHLEDYKPEELFELFCLYAKNADYTLSPEAKNTAYSAIEEIFKNRGKDFANGRTIRNLFDETVRKMSVRLAASSNLTKESMSTITEEDIPHEDKKVLTVQEILSELDGLIGMENVKREVRELCQTVQMNQKREAQGIQTEKPSIHIVFTGNPGTGKTTVARLLGKLFHAMQLLPSDKVVEVDKSGMVGQYIGETPKLVNKVIDSAMGGVLFIDEAYALAGDGFHIDTFGKEAIDTLLKRMEDDRGKFIVIAAGYKMEMENFIQANPGLKSRFTHFIHLEDYSPEELYELFRLYSKKASYSIDMEAERAARDTIKDIFDNRGKDFANGRTIRNFFNNVVRKLSARVATLPESEQTREALTTITKEDIQVEEKQ